MSHKEVLFCLLSASITHFVIGVFRLPQWHLLPPPAPAVPAPWPTARLRADQSGLSIVAPLASKRFATDNTDFQLLSPQGTEEKPDDFNLLDENVSEKEADDLDEEDGPLLRHDSSEGEEEL